MTLDPKKWPRQLLESTSMDLSAFVGFRESTLPNGMRIIDAYSASGLNFTLLPDRGLDIWSASYKGLPLTWLSPGSPHRADWGASWIRQFNGGLLTTCGLANVGPAEIDDITGERRDIHGNFTRLRANNVEIDSSISRWIEHGNDTDYRYELSLKAALFDAPLFGTQYEVRRTYWLGQRYAQIAMADKITNRGDTPAPFMLLYHFNLGFPLIQEGSQLTTPYAAVYPRDAAAQAGFAKWDRYDAPTPNYAEQVFYHHLNQQVVYGGRTTLYQKVLLAAPDNALALKLTWDAEALPYFTQWKNTRSGQYVCGIEPGNCIPEGQNAARKNGRLVMLEPGQSAETYFDLEFLDDPATIQQLRDYLQNTEHAPNSTCKLDDFAAKYPQNFSRTQEQ